MKTFAKLSALVGTFLLTGATAAFAGRYPPPTEPPSGREISQGGGGLAFTGGEIRVWMVILVALVAAGVTALILGRRRAARASR